MQHKTKFYQYFFENHDYQPKLFLSVIKETMEESKYVVEVTKSIRFYRSLSRYKNANEGAKERGARNLQTQRFGLCNSSKQIQRTRCQKMSILLYLEIPSCNVTEFRSLCITFIHETLILIHGSRVGRGV